MSFFWVGLVVLDRSVVAGLPMLLFIPFRLTSKTLEVDFSRLGGERSLRNPISGLAV